MPFSTYLPEHMGSATLAPAGPFVAGSHAELTLIYTAGTFGIDDSGMLKISWRTTSDMAKPQFDDPPAANYTTVEASNGAKLEVLGRAAQHPPLGEHAADPRRPRLSARRATRSPCASATAAAGSPGCGCRPTAREHFELKTYVDAFATYEFTELPVSPAFDLVPGPAARWKAILPSLAVAGEPFRLAIVAEDMWGNPSDNGRHAVSCCKPSQPIRGLARRRSPSSPATGRSCSRISSSDGLATSICGSWPRAATSSRAPIRCASSRRRRCGATGATCTARAARPSARIRRKSYFRYARDTAFLDIVGHQGNDFQITDAFWQELNRLTAAFDVPGKFVCVPGYEWSGNTGMGGDRNVFYRREGRPIRRSSHILVDGQTATEAMLHRRQDLFDALKDEDAVVIAHVGGRYADICTRA